MNEFEDGKFSYYESSLMFHGSLMNIMGTRFDIIIMGKSKCESEAVWYKVESELKRLNRMLNRFDPASEVSNINRTIAHQSIRVSDEMWQILNSCKRYHKETFGLFDITLKDFGTIQFHEQNKSVSFSQPGIHIDFGGYGKGYALKSIKRILEDATVHQCFVDFGNSSILGMGHHPLAMHGQSASKTRLSQVRQLMKYPCMMQHFPFQGIPRHTRGILSIQSPGSLKWNKSWYLY